MVHQPPEFSCTVVQAVDRARIRVEGEVDIATIDAIDRELRRCHDEGVPHVVLDLCAVTFLDSVGVRLLLRWAKVGELHAWDLRFALESPPVLAVLRLAGVRELLPPAEPALD